MKGPRKTRKSVLRTSLPWLWRILCTVGNVVHVYHISSGYQEYPMSSEVNILYPEIQDVPSITFCFLTLQIFDWQKVARDKSDLFEMVKQDLKRIDPTFEDENITIAEKIVDLHPLLRIQLTSKYLSLLTEEETVNLTLDSDAFFTDVRKFDGMFSYQTFRGDQLIREFFTITVSTTTLYKCFTIQDSANGLPRNYSTISINRAINRRGALMMYKFNAKTEKFVNRLMLSFSLSPRIPRLGFEKFLTVSSIKERNILSYDSVVNRLLGPPYGKCFDYSQSKWRNQPHCIDSCILESAINATQRIPPGITLTNDLRSPRHLKYLPFIDGNNAALLRQITRQCAESDSCSKLDCESKILVPKKISAIGSTGSTFYLFSNLSPTTHVTFVPQVSFSEYFVDLTSTFGFWTGLNVLQTLTFTLNLCGKWSEWKCLHF